MKCKRILSVLLAGILLCEPVGSTITAYAAPTDADSTQTAEASTEPAVDEAAKATADAILGHLTKEDYASVTTVLMTAEHPMKVLELLDQDSRYNMYAGMSDDIRFQLKNRIMYDFTELLTEMEETGAEKQKVDTMLDLFNEFLGNLPSESDMLDNMITDEDIEQMKANADQAVLDAVNDIHQSKDGKQFQSLTEYMDYLQQNTSLDVTEIINQLKGLWYSPSDQVEAKTKEVRAYLYSVYGFDDESEEPEPEEPVKGETEKPEGEKTEGKADHIHITGFADYDMEAGEPLKEKEVYEGLRDEAKAEFPKTLSMYVEGEEDPVDVPVNWVPYMTDEKQEVGLFTYQAEPADGYAYGPDVLESVFHMKGSLPFIELNVKRVETLRPEPLHTNPSAIKSWITYEGNFQTWGKRYGENDGVIGTEGEGKRMESIRISIQNNGSDVGVRYRGYIEGQGWTGWYYNGGDCGTIGQSKRLEILEIGLYGTNASDVQLQVHTHCQTTGWQAKTVTGPTNTITFGATGKRIEAFAASIVPVFSGKTGYHRTNCSGCISYQCTAPVIAWKGGGSTGEGSGASKVTCPETGIAYGPNWCGVCQASGIYARMYYDTIWEHHWRCIHGEHSGGWIRTYYSVAAHCTRNGGPASSQGGDPNLLTVYNNYKRCPGHNTPNTYTVYYNGNGATGGSTAASGHTYDTSRNLTWNGFSRAGYTFAGWATSPSGGVVYGNGASVKNLTATNGGSVTLYAKWTPNTFTVNYYSNGGTWTNPNYNSGNSVAGANQYITSFAFPYDAVDSHYDYSTFGLTKTGYQGTGYWGTSTSGGTQVSQSDNLTGQQLAQRYGQDITWGSKSINVYAQWKPLPTTTLDVNGELDGVWQNNTGGIATFDVYINGSLVANDATDFCTKYATGTKYEIKDIRAVSGKKYIGSSGAALSGTIGSTDLSVNLRGVTLVELDVNGNLNGTVYGNTTGWLTFDVYINGALVVNDASDYCNRELAKGTTFNITDIKAVGDHRYTGVKAGALSGTLNSSVYTQLGAIELHYLDPYGILNGKRYYDTNGFGTYDVYVNGKQVANDTNSYCDKFDYGSNYEIKDIKANPGYKYEGIVEGDVTKYPEGEAQAMPKTGYPAKGTLDTTKWVHMKFSGNTMTINYHLNGGTDVASDNNFASGDPARVVKINYPNTIGANGLYDVTTARVTPPTGYLIKKVWNTKPDGSGKDYNFTTEYKLTDLDANIMNGDCTIDLYAQYTPKTLVTTFHRNAGSSDTVTAQQTFTYDVAGQKFTDKKWTRTGYTLLGWADAKTATKQQYAILSGVSNSWINSHAPKNDIYAVWKAHEYNVSFDGNGATGGSTPSINATYDKNWKVPENGFQKGPFEFIEWNTKPDGSGTTYVPGTDVKNLTSKDGDKITLYAIWEEQVKVVYEGNGATAGTQKTDMVNAEDLDEQYNYTVKKNKAYTDYSRTGHEFDGWWFDKIDSANGYLTNQAKFYQDDKTNKVRWEILMGNAGASVSMPFRAVGFSALAEAKASNEVKTVPMYAQWDKEPELTIDNGKNTRSFFEGVDITEKDLLKGVSVKDYEDDLTGTVLDIKVVKIEYAAGKLVDGEAQPAYTQTFKNGMTDADKLDTWFLQMEKNAEVTHKVTYEVTDSGGNTVQATGNVYVKYNNFPEFKTADDRYFTLEEAKAGKITETELLNNQLSKGIVVHDEEEDYFTTPGNGPKKVNLVDFNAEEFKNFTESGYRTITIHTQDSYGPGGKGKETTKQIVVYVVKDGELPDVNKAKAVRFIDEENYNKNKDVDPETMTETEIKQRNANGGLNVNSKWYHDEEYRNEIEGTFDKTSGDSYHFTEEEVEQIKAYVDDHGVGNMQEDNALSDFADQFLNK